MLFTTFPFLVFLLIVFLLYWKLPQRFQWIILLAASYFSIWYWDPSAVVIMIITTLVAYGASHRMVTHKKRKSLILAASLTVYLGILFLFKYYNFFTTLLPAKTLPRLSLVVPLGLSFYTFQTIGYLIDVYRGTIKPEKHVGYLALFTSFFPQLAAGPIERAEELLPQLKTKKTFQYAQAVSGLKLFALGVFKKMVIADNLAVVVDHVFTNLPQYKGLSLILTMVIYSWQIYIDFSGYTDMAHGVARILGVDLVPNFSLPYMATSVRDFWRRWHMSLSRWFRDYLYISLGGNRKGLWRTCLNTFIVFVLCGIWHGAAWTFIIWGAFHGIVMAAETLTRAFTGNRIRLPRIVQIAYAYTMICISWIFFRAPTMPDALTVLREALVGAKHFVSPSYIMATLTQVFGTNTVEMLLTFGFLAIALSIDWLSTTDAFSKRFTRQPALIRFAGYVLLILAIFHLRNATIKEFVYVRF